MDYEISKTNGQQYYLKDVIRVVDPKQQKLYIKHDVYPIDMYTTTDIIVNKGTGEKTIDDKLIMIFPKETSKPLYLLWKEHLLK